MLFDPDTSEIKKICESLINSKIYISFRIILQNGNNYNGEINNCNIVGDIMEDILYPYIKNYISSFEKGPKQASPDFYNREKQWEWELKCFNNKPCFDISNYNSYILQLYQNLERKMYKTQYLIFKYNLKDNLIEIIDLKLCNIWEMINYNGKNPISLQSKKGMWYNIRPCTFNDMNNSTKTPELFIKQICKSINESPNKIENKEEIIENIYNQFNKLQSKNTIIS